MTGPTALLTHRGALVCWDSAQRRLTHHAPAASLPLVWFLSPGNALTADPGGAKVPASTAVVVPLDDCNDIALACDGRFLAAADRGVLVATGDGQTEAGRFTPISAEAAADLCELASHRWVVRHADMPDAALEMTGRDGFRIGARHYRLAETLPLTETRRTASGALASALLVRQGWQTDEILRFAPLVVFVLFGSGKVAAQFAMAARSLRAFGRYDGDVLMIGDQPGTALAAYLPHNRVLLHPLSAAADRLDMVAARLLIGELPLIADRQPVVYADADVVFDAPLAPILHALLCQKAMTAQAELLNPLPESPTVGGTLFAADPMAVNWPFGFNAGLWGFPSLHAHGRTLRATRRALLAHAARYGRDGLPGQDQSMANYIAARLDDFDPALFSRHTRTPPRPGRLPDAKGAVGFVHFWLYSKDAAARAEGMAASVAALRTAPPVVQRAPEISKASWPARRARLRRSVREAIRGTAWAEWLLRRLRR